MPIHDYNSESVTAVFRVAIKHCIGLASHVDQTMRMFPSFSNIILDDGTITLDYSVKNEPTLSAFKKRIKIGLGINAPAKYAANSFLFLSNVYCK